MIESPTGPLQGTDLDKLCVNTIRFLAVDAVQKANSGHPGAPMSLAEFANVLWGQFLKFDPDDPHWADRDRFVLSAGHASMLLYSMLHVTGYDLPIEQLKSFRQYGSKTPGHPEQFMTPGVEATTGPLGQGISNAVGMAIAETWLAAQFNGAGHAPVDHFTYVIASDGDLEEGVTAEAVSLAGHLALGKLIVFYDSNHISIEGPTSLAYSDDVATRFKGYHWHVREIDGLNGAEIADALREAQAEIDRPSIIIGRTTIAFGSPNMAGSSESHGSPLGEEEVRATKRNLGWPEDSQFEVPDAVRERFKEAADRGRAARKDWLRRQDAFRAAEPAKATIWDQCWADRPPLDLADHAPKFEPGKAVATRKSAGQALEAMMKRVPNLIGGSADLAPSTLTLFKQYGSYSKENRGGRNFHFGIREHAMGSALNGMHYHGGVRGFGATFLVFSDYMRPAIRLAALSHLCPVFVFTHDSIFLGEDGPTHQPIEHFAALRVIPNNTFIRPCDGAESAQAWIAALRNTGGPTCLALSRQNLPELAHGDGTVAPAEGLHKGAYVLIGGDADAAGKVGADVTIMASGSEVALALDAAKLLKEKTGKTARVVSFPCHEFFAKQPAAYRKSVLGGGRRVAIEAGVKMGWERWIGDEGLFIGMDHFGASAPAKRLAEEFGFTPEKVVARIVEWLG